MKKKKLPLRWLGMLMILVCMVFWVSVPAMAEEVSADPEPVCYEHGDVNSDGHVDSRDAIYVLYHCFFEEDPAYAVNQNCDFNQDGRLTPEDAVYVLYSAFGGVLEQSHPLNGTVHQYYAPLWNWLEDGTVEVSLKCGCGQTKLLTEADGLTVTVSQQPPATCVDTGVVEYTASVSIDDTVFSDTKRVQTPVAGHVMEGVQGCETESRCTICDYKLEPLGHDWVLDENQSVPATCTAQAIQVYRCSNTDCEQEHRITLEGLAEHAYAFDRTETLDKCGYQEILKCSCGEEIFGEVYYKHQYTAELTREANCRETGIKTMRCSCGDSYTESIPENDAHNWTEDATADGITAYSCGCGATKTAVCTVGDSASVTRQMLQKSDEIQIQDISISLNENVIDNLGENVQIQITTTSADVLDVDDAAKQQIGSNPVYDISLTSDDLDVSELNGTATVSVPYTLRGGDDVDCIDIWFIAEDGTVECVQGTYANGYVTFTTTHFSYYTVTRLTPAQRCATYGHAIGTSHADATCTRDGFHKEVCQRCGYVQADEILTKQEHAYRQEREEATCLTDGSFRKVCENCAETISGTIPALGHSWKLDETQSVEASCKAAGKKVYVCSRENCGVSYTEESAQLDHDYGTEEETSADCDSQGHKKRICKLCGYEYVTDQTAPTGHDYLAENVIWEWSEDCTSATATLVCSYNKNHTKVLKAVVSSKKEGNACQDNSVLIYTAEASFNKYTYTDTKTVAREKADHQPQETWKKDADGHSRKCKICAEEIDAGKHVWGQLTVITEATCTQKGLAEQSCTLCGYTAEVVLEATREHDYVNGICKDCGFAEASCNHIRTHKTPLDLGTYGVCEGTDIRWVSCDCGEVKYLYLQSLLCDMEDSNREETLPSGERVYISIETCRDCGLTIEWRGYSQTDAETCYSTEVQDQKLLVGGELIASGHQQFVGEASGFHICNIPGETLELSQYGDLCGVTLKTWHCACGQRSYTYIEEDTCRWSWDEEQSSDDVDVYVCRVCGAVRKEVHTSAAKAEDCSIINTYEVVYEVDGQQIYSYTNQEDWYRHDYEVTEVVLDGNSCTDGVYVEQVCRNCGNTNAYYSEYHSDTQIVKTKLEGFCSDTFVQTVCACGERKNCYLESSGNSYCSFTNTSKTTSICEDCGLTRIRETTTGAKDENCIAHKITAYTYKDKDGKTIATGEEVYTSEEHNYKQETELTGKSCEDGVKVIRTCLDCGYVNRYTTRGHVQIQTRYDLSKYGLCSGELVTYTCPCGERNGYRTENSGCQWEYVSGDKNTETAVCPSCQITRTVTEKEPEPIGTCMLRYPVTIAYSSDGKNLLEVNCAQSRDNHREVYTLTALDADCEEVRVKSTCLTCGETDEWESSNSEGHGTWAVSRKWLSQGTLCGDLELVTYSCACGQVTEQNVQWHNGECDFDGSTYLGEDKGYISTCSRCGVTKTWTADSGKVKDSCLRENTQQVTFSKNETTLFSYSTNDVWQNHDYVSSFNLFGTTCAEGFELTQTCFDCGKTRTSVEYDTSCDNWHRVATEVLYNGEGICGKVIKYSDGCACGNNRDIGVADSCQWDYLTGDNDTDTYICEECGVQKIQYRKSTVDPDNCNRTYQCEYTYEKEGTQLVNTKFSYTTKSHEYVAEYELMGDSCEDGYYVTEHCARCGYDRENRYFRTGHNTHQTEFYDLRKYGMCGGEIWRYSCACGKYSEWNYNNDCSSQHVGEDSVTGLNQYYCSECGTYRILGEVGSTVPGTCDWKGTFYGILSRDGETLLNLKQPETYKSHQRVMENVTLYDPDQGCEGGYRATMQCIYCEDSYTTSGYEHDTNPVEYLYLKDLYPEICGDGYITRNQCACGQYSSVGWNDIKCSYNWNSSSYEGADGYTHQVETRLCSDCGFARTEDYFVEKTPGVCLQYKNSTWTVSANGQTLKTWTTRTEQNAHTTQRTYSLLPGSSSCEDGLRVMETCKYCDYESSWGYSSGSGNHNNYNLDQENSIDLTQYGSVCGGTLARYVCACGKQQRYDFTPETLCDIDQYSISNWIPGAINTWQYTSEGQVWTSSYAYRMTCAVTDPDCGLKIRMSEYWLEKNCTAIEYQTWQLGYDDQTGTCQYEFTIETGDRHAYHTYQSSSSISNLADGTQLNSDVQFCPKCSSSYTVNEYLKNGTRVKRVERAVNTLNNGENKGFTRTYEYGLEHAGYVYMTLQSYEVTYADGSTYWEKYEYTYDFTSGCRRTRTYTDSSGVRQVGQENAHIEKWHREYGKQPTCTQYGVYWDVYSCPVCNLEYQRYEYQWSPTAHDWHWDNGKQFYICYDCGLENINGASGEIVLEDMTDAYGAGKNYVVGYWNRGGVDALRYVSVVLKDVAEGENDELVLTDIAFTYLTREKEGITAVTFSQAAVQTAAEQAVVAAGYTGNYAIRFTFVPKYSEDTLDYAITFDDLAV